MAAVAMLSGCDDSGYIDDDWLPVYDAHYIYTSAETVSLASEEGSASGEHIYAENTEWQFDTPAEWLSVSPMSGNDDATVTFTSKSANPSGENIRTSVFALKSAVSAYNYSHQISVTQAISPSYLETIVDGQMQNGMFIDTGAYTTRTIDVNTNLEWVVTSNQDWCHAVATTDGKHINVTVDDNPTQSSRSAVLTIKSSVLTKQFEIVQAGSNVKVSDNTLEYGCSAGQYTIAVTSDLPWTASPTQGTSWITVTPSSGSAGTTNVTISATENASTSSRSCYVDFLMEDNKAASVKVTQEGMSLKLSETELTFNANGESNQVSVTSNTSWQVLDLPSWITASATSGIGNETLKLTAADYWGITNRTATITVACPLVPSLSRQLKLTQSKRDIKPLRSLQFNADADKDTVHVNLAHAWTATPQGDGAEWITVSPSSATGADILTVSVTENTVDAERSGSILVKAGEVSTVIAVSQRGKYFDVSPTAATLPQSGGTHVVSISTNGTWTAASGSAWMHLSATSGKGDVELKLTADANKSTMQRCDTTTITPAHTQPIRIITAQEGYYLRADNTSLILNGKGGRSNTVIVTTNCAYTLKADYDGAAQWFTITEDGTTFFITADENDTEAERTAKVIITLKDVPDSDPGRTIVIPVTQRYFKPGVNVEPFGPDQQWEISTDGSITIRVTGFSEDKSLDGTSNVNADIPVKDFGEDSNWD